MKKALIAFHEPAVARGGMGRVGIAQALVLQSLGWDTTVLGSDSIGPTWRSQRFPALDPFLSAQQLNLQIQRIAKQYDLILTHGLCAYLGPSRRHLHLYHGTCAGLALACKKYLSRAEYLILSRLNTLGEWAGGVRATRLAVSRPVALEVERHLRLARSLVIYNGVDTGCFRPTFRSPESRYWGLIAGRVDVGKGRLTLAALDGLLGDSYGMRLASAVVHPSCVWTGARTQVMGPVDYADMPALYGSVDYVLNLSRYEGFGLTVVEAWSCGIPVITTNVGIIRELKGQEPALDQLVVDDPDDAQAFADRIRLLRSDPGLGQRQVQWARELVNERFSLARMKRDYQSLIQSL